MPLQQHSSKAWMFALGKGGTCSGHSSRAARHAHRLACLALRHRRQGDGAGNERNCIAVPANNVFGHHVDEDLLLHPLLGHLDDEFQRLRLRKAEHAALDDVAFAILFSDQQQREQKMLGSVCQGQASEACSSCTTEQEEPTCM